MTTEGVDQDATKVSLLLKLDLPIKYPWSPVVFFLFVLYLVSISFFAVFVPYHQPARITFVQHEVCDRFVVASEHLELF